MPPPRACTRKTEGEATGGTKTKPGDTAEGSLQPLLYPRQEAQQQNMGGHE